MVSFRGSNWAIEKRFNDFVALRQGLAREFRDRDVGALPKRRFFNRFDPQFLSERSQALQAFLANALVKIPVITSESMLNFLEVTSHVNMEKPVNPEDTPNEDLAAEYEELEQKRLADLVQSFADRMIDSQSVKVESRDDAQVEEKRQRLLLACGGFRAHDDHLKSFFNDPTPKAMGANEVIEMYNAPLQMSVKEQHMVIGCMDKSRVTSYVLVHRAAALEDSPARRV
eukprot:jgi/Undpi1/3886/HiC_scaffold_16.g07254.m1